MVMYFRTFGVIPSSPPQFTHLMVAVALWYVPRIHGVVCYGINGKVMEDNRSYRDVLLGCMRISLDLFKVQVACFLSFLCTISQDLAV